MIFKLFFQVLLMLIIFASCRLPQPLSTVSHKFPDSPNQIWESKEHLGPGVHYLEMGVYNAVDSQTLKHLLIYQYDCGKNEHIRIDLETSSVIMDNSQYYAIGFGDPKLLDSLAIKQIIPLTKEEKAFFEMVSQNAKSQDCKNFPPNRIIGFIKITP